METIYRISFFLHFGTMPKEDELTFVPLNSIRNAWRAGRYRSVLVPVNNR